MKSFAFVLAVGACCVAAAPLRAQPSVAPLGDPGAGLHQTAAYGDPPMPGRHGGRKGGRHASKSTTPTLPSTKGVSQEDADKQYRKKYGF